MTQIVAVMQPYFYPYAGYFSLVHAVDHFVLFDCVQFPRRGWVHRNRVPGPGGPEEWFTLPLARQPREVRIRDLAFATDAGERLRIMVDRYPWLGGANDRAEAIRVQLLSAPDGSPAEFLAASIKLCASVLGMKPSFSFSSNLGLGTELKGQDRVMAAVRAVGGTRYVNPSGGRVLYDRESFARNGLELAFLDPYRGPAWSMLHRLCTEAPSDLAKEIAENARPRLA